MVQPEFWLGILWDIVATVAACIAGIFSWSIRGRLHRFDSDLAALRKRLDDGQEKCRERHEALEGDIGFLKGKVNSK